MAAYRFTCLLFFLLALISIQAQHADSLQVYEVEIKQNEVLQHLEKQIRWWEDPSSTASVEEASRQSFRNFEELEVDSLTPRATFWGAVSLRNPLPDSSTWIISFGSGDTVECFIKTSDGWSSRLSGANIAVSKRELVFRGDGAFRFEVGPGDTLRLLYRSREVMRAPPIVSATVYSELGFSNMKLRYFANEVVIVGMFQAILLIMLLYNFMIFITTRELTYFWYALYLLSLLGALYFDTTVRNYPVIGFDTPSLNNISSGLLLSSTSLWYFLFGRSFLNAREITPGWDKAIKVIVGIRLLFLIGMVFTFLLNSQSFGWFVANQILLAGEILFLLLYFFRLGKVGGALVWFFIVGSGVVFLFGFMQLLLRNFIQVNTFVFFLGSVIVEILIFSLGLGYKVRKSQKDKLIAERALNMELSKVNTAFGRFVPHEFLKSLGRANATEVLLGDQVERKVTVLFSDIRSYTTLSEQMTPKENFDFLNGYLGRIGPVIQQHHGFVNQYYGDGIMALFMSHPSDAVEAAIEIQQTVARYNQEREAKHRDPIKIGVGLHTGMLMMGVIGDTLRMNAGVVSDSVNTASRMEGLTKQFGVNILLSETTAEELTQRNSLRSLGRVLVKGRVTPMAIYECFAADSPEEADSKSRSLEMHNQALQHFVEGEFAEALRVWDQSLVISPNDQVLLRFQKMCQKYLLQGIPEGWNGVEEMQNK
ncbi:MAG: hypothetical protein NWR72_01780 [Bacteroidia bacterium]|nr:hypothetical protein [Bacteroidia bacterium]